MSSISALDWTHYGKWYETNRETLVGRSPFHEPEWLNAISGATGFDLRFVGVMDGSELTTVVPGFLTRTGLVRMFGSPLRGTLTSYLGPVGLDPAVFDGGTDLALRVANFARRKWWTPYYQCTLRDAPSEMPPPPGPGWHQQRPSSYRLDLTIGEEELFAGLKSKCRRNVRKAAREGVKIVELDDVATFYAILESTMNRHGSSSWHSQQFFERLIRGLDGSGLLHAWAAEYEDQIIAAGLFLSDENEMHYLSGASLPKFGSLPTSYLLHWHAISWAARSGMQVFNSEASRIPSIDYFKESFSPELERRHSLIRAPGLLWRARKSFVRWSRFVRARRARTAEHSQAGASR